MKKNVSTYVVLAVFSCISILSCKKNNSVAPFQDKVFKVKSVEELQELEGFAALYKNIFKPTCASPGCHDGTFPPDFRTMYSSYNTLVSHPVVKFGPDTTVDVRVFPGNENQSMLYRRMTEWELGTGTMPLAPADQEPIWADFEEQYIQDVVDWIQEGALDIFGNAPIDGNPVPQVQGLQIFNTGNTTTPYNRNGGGDIPPIEVSKNSSNNSVDIWLSLIDNSTAPENFTLTKVKIADNPNHFDTADSLSLDLVSSIQEKDFWDSTVTFTHKATYDISKWNPEQYLYVRAYLKDAEQTTPSEIPNEVSNEDVFAKYFIIKLKP